MARKKVIRDFKGENEHEKELFRQLSMLEGKYSLSDVFRDFVYYSALRISNLCDSVHLEERKKQIEDPLEKYKGRIDLEECFRTLVKAMQENQQRGVLRDVLGTIFESIGMSNYRTGQFFTPEDISRLMAKMTIGNKIQELKCKPYVTVCDPCIGSGRMLLAFANEMQDMNYNYCMQMVGMAADIDMTCVLMSYVQFSLYGIPAVVIHGDSIAVKEWSRWYTPAYVWGGWVFAQPMSFTDYLAEDDVKLRQITVEAMAQAQKELLAEVV